MIMSSQNPSPFRYPGGKHKISRLVDLILSKTGASVYVEPFAGGAGVALELLLSGTVDRIVINDSDRAVYSAWRAMLEDSSEFVDRIGNAELTLKEWNRQRQIYLDSTKYSFDYGFATFFLNRTNHSGIITSGPIGGREQHTWRLDARFNREALMKKVQAIGELRRQIKLYNRDVFGFLRTCLPKAGDEAFVYLDPPYYRKGKALYKNYFTPESHRRLKDVVFAMSLPWIVTYDNVPEIIELYKGAPSMQFSLSYSLANNGMGREVMLFPDRDLIPSIDEIENLGMRSVFS